MWEIDLYPLEGTFTDDFNKMIDDKPLESLLDELVEMDDPEMHRCVVECPHIPGIYNAIKFMCDNVFLIVSLERIMANTEYEQNIMVLYSCGNYQQGF